MDYLTRLVQRALGVPSDVPVVQPLVPSRFEVGAETMSTALTPSEETSEAADAGAVRQPATANVAHVTPAATTPAAPQPIAHASTQTLTQPSEEIQTEQDAQRPTSDGGIPDDRSRIITRRLSAPIVVTTPAAKTDTDATSSGISSVPPTRRKVPPTPATVPGDSATEMFGNRDIQSEANAPVIRVTIGRVDVRAVTPTAPIAPHKPAATAPSTPSLEDYLRGRPGDHRP